MPTTLLSSGTAAQLLGLGIPAEKHTFEDLRRIVPPFEGLCSMTDIEALAEIVVYLGRHSILPVKANTWKSLPWGTHACLFYKTNHELSAPFKNYFKEGLMHNERCVWVISKTFDNDKALSLVEELLEETKVGDNAFELIRHQDWYETPSGRFRSTNEIVMGWLNRIEKAIMSGFSGLRVAGDAHFHPDDLQNFFKYEGSVNNSIGTLKIKALCTYCIPHFSAPQIQSILKTHQSAFGDFAISEK